MDTTTMKVKSNGECVELVCTAYHHHDGEAALVRLWEDTGCAGSVPSLTDVLAAATLHTSTTHARWRP